jgi:hypothetical protein
LETWGVETAGPENALIERQGRLSDDSATPTRLTNALI